MYSDELEQRSSLEGTERVLTQGHLETLFRATHDVVMVLDGETQEILFVNHTALRVLGYAPEALIGTAFAALLPDEAQDHLKEAELVDGVYGPMSFRSAGGDVRNADVTVAVVPWNGKAALLYSLRDVTQRTLMEQEREKLIQDLQDALATVKQLSGLLPICANCKRIRDGEGNWSNLERYISAHSGAQFSHGICPSCRDELYPELGEG